MKVIVYDVKALSHGLSRHTRDHFLRFPQKPKKLYFSKALFNSIKLFSAMQESHSKKKEPIDVS